MKAVSIDEYGGRDVLNYEGVPIPEINEDEVLVRVAATSVNPFDWAVRSGYVTDYYSYSFPLILGLDVSGVVEAVGSEVQGIEPGQDVFGRADPALNGAYAEYISMPASHVATKPQSLDHLHAAAVPHVGISAWSALVEIANLTAGQSVLIHGAAGGVGTIAVQIAKSRRARVIGTASAYNQDYLRRIGADQVIDYNATKFEESVDGVDVVLDLVGDMMDNTQQRSWQVIKPGGLLVSLVQFPSPEEAAANNARGVFASADKCDEQTLNELGQLIDEGQVKIEVSSVYPLADIRQAHKQSESRHVRGKIAVHTTEL